MVLESTGKTAPIHKWVPISSGSPANLEHTFKRPLKKNIPFKIVISSPRILFFATVSIGTPESGMEVGTRRVLSWIHKPESTPIFSFISLGEREFLFFVTDFVIGVLRLADLLGVRDEERAETFSLATSFGILTTAVARVIETEAYDVAALRREI
jgi:hypothetical protein